MKLNKKKCQILPISKRLIIKENEQIAKMDVVNKIKWNGIWLNNNMNLEFQLEDLNKRIKK